jgi:hypothetical protein
VREAPPLAQEPGQFRMRIHARFELAVQLQENAVVIDEGGIALLWVRRSEHLLRRGEAEKDPHAEKAHPGEELHHGEPLHGRRHFPQRRGDFRAAQHRANRVADYETGEHVPELRW